MCSIFKKTEDCLISSSTHRLKGDERGIVSQEFAIISPLLILMIIGIFELGTIMLVNSLMEGAMRESSRYGITGRADSGISRESYIRQIVDEQTLGFVDMDKAKFETLVYSDFGSIGDGEPYIDGNGNGAYDVGETFTDENSNGAWDADVGEDSAGAADDVVLYRISYNWPIMTPLIGALIGTDGHFPMEASIAVRNEPWE
ncbi:TadE/TadG family type IV pilus assembly protein [Aestuariispira insulae]|uniref:TadE-like protein n=1 Tax=Aestuariispira insulae TaxID=1461337 RepID=A0A3D9HVI6_9PROT|nr:TadE/TadG family type IV pilus assembly protein [Aestuariispira insulae]RED53450.1 TadE-like protein [Aestuariispira insulae]